MTNNGRIIKVMAIAEVFPHGQRVSAAVVEYDRVICNAELRPECYTVNGRTITKVYANSVPEKTDKGTDGKYVVIELCVRDETASTLHKEEGPGLPGGPPKNITVIHRKPEVKLSQIKEITVIDGGICPPTGEMVSVQAICPIVDDFVQAEFDGIPYNLFIPRNYNEKKAYPLVMFIHDAEPTGSDPMLTLTQGNGAVNWASPADQAKHACFVLAPQIPKGIKLTGNNFQASPEIEIIKSMLDSIVCSYSIDRNSIYTTGQSMGCMASCELNIRYPDYFAASLLVAGQWDPEKMKSLKHKNFWILVSEKDARAFPGMNAVTEALESAGAKIGRYRWNAKADALELERKVQEALKDDCTIRYTVFEDSSVVPEGIEPGPGTNHMNTWPVAYAIDGIRDWLFTNSKNR